jgi:hypothetical protein
MRLSMRDARELLLVVAWVKARVVGELDTDEHHSIHMYTSNPTTCVNILRALALTKNCLIALDEFAAALDHNETSALTLHYLASLTNISTTLRPVCHRDNRRHRVDLGVFNVRYRNMETLPLKKSDVAYYTTQAHAASLRTISRHHAITL